MKLTVLLVEPQEDLRERVQAALRGDGHRVLAFPRAESAVHALSESTLRPALALITAGPDPGVDGLLNLLGDLSATCQKVWIAPPGKSEVDRLAASRRPRGLLSRSALEEEAVLLARRVQESRERARLRVGTPPMLGESAAVSEVRRLIERIAAAGAGSVLITGESGTGKEVAARRIHALGPRAHAPFVEVDCAAIPANLLESELFGYEAGAFTDARGRRTGLLETAQGGTVFLDEVGELDLGLQAKLLRVLDTRRFRRLGGSAEIPLDVNFVAATNRDLAQEVRRGRFRSDLYYRLDVVRLHLPPVREREGDAWILARAFLEEAARRVGRKPPRLVPALRKEIEDYRWPGNVREIRNHMERLVLLHPQDADVITDVQLPATTRNPETGGVGFDFSRGPVPWERIERKAIEAALATAGGNVSEAARLLGLGRGALRYRMTRHGIQATNEGARKAA